MTRTDRNLIFKSKQFANILHFPQILHIAAVAEFDNHKHLVYHATSDPLILFILLIIILTVKTDSRKSSSSSAACRVILSLSDLQCLTMEFGHPEDKSSSFLHASKSESNLFSFSGISASHQMNAACSIQGISNSENIDAMVTSTPAPTTQDHNFQTPRRNAFFPKSSGSSSNKRLIRTSSEVSKTSSGSRAPRINPFDSQISVEKLHLPTCSPSVFSIVVSPSQESVSVSLCYSKTSFLTILSFD